MGISDAAGVRGGIAILGTIGRKRVRFALTDEAGALRPDTIRDYDALATTGVSAALTGYQRDLGLRALPARSAFCVAGLARGDAISITQTRWFLSRSGMKAMLGEAPLILNDFAAEACAICGVDVSPVESFGGSARPNTRDAGCYVVVGMTSGLGVAVVNRSATGVLTVLPTEAGHGVFAAATGELAALATEMFPGRHAIAAEEIVSASGLVEIYNLVAARGGTAAKARTPEDVTRLASSDPVARAACELLAKAFWAQAASLTMTFGAWDGLLITGALAGAIRPFLRNRVAQDLFTGSRKYQRVLQGVPRVLVRMENCQLLGLAEALRHDHAPQGIDPARTAMSSAALAA